MLKKNIDLRVIKKLLRSGKEFPKRIKTKEGKKLSLLTGKFKN